MKRWSSIATGLLVIGFTLAGCTHRPPGPGDPEWSTLFDGTRASLDNWYQVGEANWRFEYGNLVADKRTSKIIPTFVSKKSYTDFQIRAEFWASHDANSGVYFRISDPKKIGGATAYEANIYDTAPNPSYGTGAINRVATVNPMPKAGGRWNVMEITARGNRLTVWFNGNLTVDVLDDKFKSGPIALQYGQGVMKWRNVQIRPL